MKEMAEEFDIEMDEFREHMGKKYRRPIEKKSLLQITS
jgi:hypothetical protein